MSALAQVLQPDDLPANDELFGIIRERSFRRGRFTLSSGVESDMYFNLKPTMMHPRGAYLCAAAFLKFIRAESVDFVGGLEMGAVPIIGSLAAISEREGTSVATFFVRKRPKAHGTKDLIEGLGPEETLAKKRVLIADDVSTTGNSILIAVKAARDASAEVDAALVLVDREEGARENLAQAGIRLIAIFRGRAFLAP
jgi:orotate phosphoribosyltransferase